MSRDTTRRRLLAGCGTALLTALAGCSAATPFVGKETEATTTVGRRDAESLVVENDNGDVTVRAADRDDVQVRMVKQSSAAGVDLSNLELSTDREDGTLRLGSNWTGSDFALSGRPSMSLRIDVPASLAVSELHTEAGTVDARGLTGDLTATTEAGAVTLRRIDGTVTASSETGRVSVRETRAVGDLSTETGSVTARVPTIDGDTKFSSETGSVTVTLTGDVDAELTASTEVGTVTVENLDLADQTRSDNVVTGTLGEGGPEFELTAETGDVTVRRES